MGCFNKIGFIYDGEYDNIIAELKADDRDDKIMEVLS